MLTIESKMIGKDVNAKQSLIMYMKEENTLEKFSISFYQLFKWQT